MNDIITSNTLALLGGSPVREQLFPAYNVIGDDEIKSVEAVMRTGVLSRFLGLWHEHFYGGEQVQSFEREWCEHFHTTHAISVNSATSGLYAAVGAARVKAGDEVIVSPYTMSASAVAPLVYNAIPVFADIDPQTYCLSAETIRPKITERTRAIIVVHIFGAPADMVPIMDLAKEHDLVVIEDCAQAPLGIYRGQPVGTIGHMGVFSLNYHKHIHTGEGGVVVTRDDDFAERLQLIRNHAEVVVEGKGVDDLTNMVGFNYRLGEIESAIGRSLLPKLGGLIKARRENVAYLEENMAGLPGLTLQHVHESDAHCYYLHPLHYDEQHTGIRRETVVRAVRAELPACRLREDEGPLVGQGYVPPLYWQPLYQKRAHLALQGGFGNPLVDYRHGLCPNVENCHLKTLITHELMKPGMSKTDLQDVANAFHKVLSNLDALRSWEQAQQ